MSKSSNASRERRRREQIALLDDAFAPQCSLPPERRSPARRLYRVLFTLARAGYAAAVRREQRQRESQ